MRFGVLRWLPTVGAALGIGAGGIAAAAPPAIGAVPPACVAGIAARFTDVATDGNVHRMTVVLSSTTNAACTLAGFPALVLPSAQGAPLPVGHVTVPNSVALNARSPASFAIRYTTSQAPATGTCSLGVVVNDRWDSTTGTIPIVACASVTTVDVTSYASGTQPPATATVTPNSANVSPCNVPDLGLREIRTAPENQRAPDAIYALQNRGAAACRIAGSVGIRLLDGNGVAFPLRFAVRNTMALLLTLAPGAEASFTLTYVPGDPSRCPLAERIEVFVASQPAPLTAPATVTACTSALARVSNLRLGVPITLP